MPLEQPTTKAAPGLALKIVARIGRGLIGAALAAAIGWIASRYTVGLILTRQFDSSEQRQIEAALPVIYLIFGFLTGAALDRRWFDARLRPVCWGAVIALSFLMLAVRIPIWLAPKLRYWNLRLFGIPRLTLGWEEIGLLCVPGVLLVGGLLGWFFDRQIRLARRLKKNPDHISAPD
jgi:hypothetical protein